MASNAPGECCIKANLHEGQSQGKIVEFGGVETYITGDKTSKRVIIFNTDVFGIEFSNNQLVADALGRAGYYVVAPDYLEKDSIPYPLPQGFDFPTWLGKHQPATVSAIVAKTLNAVKEELKPEFIASVGYCFGAKYTVQLLNGQIDAGAIAHPSFVDDEEVKAITGPIFISAAEVDQAYPEEKRKLTESILKENNVLYHTTLAGGKVEHGFGIKGDLTKPAVKYAKEKCASDFISWFNFIAENKA